MTKNGMIVDGGVYWLERIAATGMQAYYKNCRRNACA